MAFVDSSPFIDEGRRTWDLKSAKGRLQTRDLNDKNCKTGSSCCRGQQSLIPAGCVWSSTPPPQKNVGRVAAAADLQYAFPDLADAFAKQKPEINLQPIFGSSGIFYSQLVNQAPFDLFLSADVDYPHKLEVDGKGDPHSVVVYALGRVVLLVTNESKLNPTGFADLLCANVKDRPGESAQRSLWPTGGGCPA